MEGRGYATHGAGFGSETNTGASKTGYAENPMHLQQYSPHAGVSNFGYAPDSNVQNQFPTQPGYPPVTQQPSAMQSSSNTTVIVQQTPTLQIKGPRPWSTGLCACCTDMEICLLVCCFPECYACCCFMNRINESCCFPVCFPESWMGAARTKIRTKYNIQGSMMGDFCLTTGCCIGCTRYCILCQMAREVKLMEEQGDPM